ncbi:MAG: asparagine synthase (glutamine-hydrolyzing) [Bryobacteraceae bacterium]
MCGIAGFTHLRGAANPELIREATRSIHHRGPDQNGVYESDVISLGVVRLKIIDLNGGEQPMRSGDTLIVFNGEVYNHAEIRKELEGLGVRFESRCDTEVVLKAFQQWDTASFTRLRGMFAAALWTESTRRLVLVRDRMGIKPLYIHQRGDDLYFGSELKTLFVHPEIERRLDPDGLNYYLSLNYVPGPYTLVSGIRKLPPAHWLEWKDGKTRVQRYWKADWQPRECSLDEAKEELDGLLRASVKEHLVSDVPLGIWSSGGLDSSTILHYASEGVRLKTFSVSFQGRAFDESAYFREMAQKYGTDHHEFDLNPDVELQSAIEEMPYYSDEPSADAGALPVWFLSRMSRQHVTVALSGEGADELFGGYNTYLADGYARTARSTPAFARKAALAAMQVWPASDEKISLEYKVKRMLEGSLLPPEQAHFFWNGTFSEAARQQLMRPEVFRRNPLLSEDENGIGYLNQFLRLDQANYLPDDILYKCDRMSMAHSLEVRPPFLDHRVVEFAARLPEKWKIHGGSLKYVLRELMQDKLPQSVLTRKKEGFDIPAHGWFRSLLKPLLLETVNARAVAGFLEWPAVDAVIQAHLERRANYGYHLWGLLTLFLWMKRWGIEAASTTR